MLKPTLVTFSCKYPRPLLNLLQDISDKIGIRLFVITQDRWETLTFYIKTSQNKTLWKVEDKDIEINSNMQNMFFWMLDSPFDIYIQSTSDYHATEKKAQIISIFKYIKKSVVNLNFSSKSINQNPLELLYYCNTEIESVFIPSFYLGLKKPKRHYSIWPRNYESTEQVKTMLPKIWYDVSDIDSVSFYVFFKGNILSRNLLTGKFYNPPQSIQEIIKNIAKHVKSDFIELVGSEIDKKICIMDISCFPYYLENDICEKMTYDFLYKSIKHIKE